MSAQRNGRQVRLEELAEAKDGLHRYIIGSDHLRRHGVPNKDIGVHQTNEAYCVECNCRITVGRKPSGATVEYGHRAGDEKRCSHRPDCVDPGKGGSR